MCLIQALQTEFEAPHLSTLLAYEANGDNSQHLLLQGRTSLLSITIACLIWKEAHQKDSFTRPFILKASLETGTNSGF